MLCNIPDTQANLHIKNQLHSLIFLLQNNTVGVLQTILTSQHTPNQLHTAATMSKPIAFIIGAGQNIGAGVADALQSKGYRIALAARSLKSEDSTGDRLHLPVDLSSPESVAPAFASLRKQWGEPSVVFYNGTHPHPKPPNHLSALLTY